MVMVELLIMAPKKAMRKREMLMRWLAVRVNNKISTYATIHLMITIKTRLAQIGLILKGTGPSRTRKKRTKA